MSNYMAVIKRVAEKVAASPAMELTVTAAVGYMLSEMRLADVRAKRSLLKRKHSNHLRLLGKTVYRLSSNGIDPMKDERPAMIIRVLDEIGTEIADVEEELNRRKAYEAERRKKARAERARRYRKGAAT